MFNFFSKTKAGKPVLETLKTDVHSHLLPGIDDGSPDVSTSLELIKGLKALGYTKLITTPHIMWDMYQNTRDGILSLLDEMRDVLREADVDIELDAAAEYFLDDYVMSLLKKKKRLLTFGDNNMVLAEFSMASPPIDLRAILFEMRMQDYQPVIAHPERYVYLENTKEFYDELKDAGYLFQLNLLSLAGTYGRSVKELANYLIDKGYYDLVGTDLHNQRHLKALQSNAILSPLEKLIETGQIKNPQL